MDAMRPVWRINCQGDESQIQRSQCQSLPKYYVHASHVQPEYAGEYLQRRRRNGTFSAFLRCLRRARCQIKASPDEHNVRDDARLPITPPVDIFGLCCAKAATGFTAENYKDRKLKKNNDGGGGGGWMKKKRKKKRRMKNQTKKLGFRRMQIDRAEVD